MAGPRLVATVILLVLFWDAHQADAQGLTVNIAVTRIDPPDFTPENDNDFRTSSGPHTFTCTATGGTGSGNIQYQWSSSSPTFQSSNRVITRQSISNIDDGTHTCTATRGSDTGTATVTVNIVGAGIFVFVGSGGSEVTGTQPNNGLVISNSPGGGFRFRFFCRSDNTTAGIGELLGLAGNVITNSNFFGFARVTGGEFQVENTVGPQTALPASEQGVYTCWIPLQSGVLREVNIGVYPIGFSDGPTITNPLVFTPGPSPPTLTYTSSTSIATTVTCTRSNSDGTTTTVGPLYDGNSKEFGGVTYELTQTVIFRGASTFENVLTINQPLADIVGSSFQCSVSNSIGSVASSVLLPIMGAQITDPGTLAVGEMATIQCTTSLTNIRIEWLLNDEVVVSDATGATELDLVLNPVNQNFNGRVYTCRVTVAGGDSISNMFTVMTQLPDVTVDITTAGSAEVGMSYTLTCTVSGADNLGGADIAWTGPSGNTGSGTSLQLLLDPLDLSDAGRYTCTATISSVLLENNLVLTDMVDVNLQSPGPPLNFMSTMQGTTTLSFSWDPPEPREGLTAITDYIVRCEPQLVGIPTPPEMTQSASQPLTATVSGLAPGVTYSCSIAAINDRGEGDQTEDTATTQEIAPTGAPQSFNIVPGPTARELTFFWDLPLPTERNGMITNYTISCSPDTETLPRTVPGEEGLMVGGFRPFTNYSCTIVASNSQGSGPQASATRRTDEDDASISIGFNQARYRENEGAGTVPITVQLLAGGLDRMVTIRMYTMNGVAVAPADYHAIDMTLTFGPLMTTYTTEIEIVEDNILETNEHFFVRLEVLSSDVPLSLSHNQARVIIESNDECPTAGVQVSENPLVTTDPLAIYCVDVCYRKFRRGRICHG